MASTSWVSDESRVHLRHGIGKARVEDIGVFSEEAEDEPRHEFVHVATARIRAPIWVVFQQFHIQAVQAAGGADVKGVFADLTHRADAGQRQEETEMVGKIGKGAGHRLSTAQIFNLEINSIGGQDELGLGLRSGRAISQRGQALCDLPRLAA